MTTVYTIGYEATDIDRFVATLNAVGIKLLADVRAVPLSRKKGFSKNGLRARLEEEGIAYVHLVALGDPKDGREAARSGHHDLFVRIYNKHLSQSQPQASLRELAKLVDQQTTCLMCFERDPEQCHRSIVVDQLVSGELKAFHLYGDDPERYVRNASKLPRRRAGEGAAAA